MGRMWPPQRGKIWFTPACFSVFAASSPPAPRPPPAGRPNAGHRLPAAAHRRRDLPPPLLEARKPVEDLLQLARDPGRPPLGESPHPEVLLPGHLRKDPPALRDHPYPTLDHLLG